MMAPTNGIPYFDLILDATNLKEDALRLFADLRPAWKDQDLEIKAYSEGYLNCVMSFRMKSDLTCEDAIVLRVYGSLREELATMSSDRELGVMQMAQQAGCFTAIQAVFRNGIAYREAPGRTLNMVDILNPKLIRCITRKLVAFHHFDMRSISNLINHKGELRKFGDEGGIDLASKRNYLPHMIPASLSDPEKDTRYQQNRMKTEELLSNYATMLETLDELNMSMTLTHHDFHIKNMIYDDRTGDIVFVDYEMSEIREEATDLVKLFSFRPVLEEIGMVKRDEPQITPEVRLEWIKCYLEAKYAYLGKNPDEIPEVLIELSDVEHAILEAYQVLTFVVMFHIFSGTKKHFDLDPIEQIPVLVARWEQKKQEIPALVGRYKKLKEECVRAGHL